MERRMIKKTLRKMMKKKYMEKQNMTIMRRFEQEEDTGNDERRRGTKYCTQVDNDKDRVAREKKNIEQEHKRKTFKTKR